MRRLLTLMVLLAATQAVAQTRTLERQPLNFSASYRFHVAGVDAIGIDVTAKVEGGRYTIRTATAADGMFQWMTRYTQVIETVGLAGDDGTLRPLHYVSNSNGRWGKRLVELGWNDAGEPRVLRLEPKPDEDEELFPLPKGSLADTMDPTAGMVARALVATVPNVCAGTQRYFDGRRVFALTFTPAGEVEMAANRYSAFAGRALRCDVRYTPLGGHMKKNAEQTNSAAAEPIKLWVAEGVDARVRVPVRLEVENGWGSLIVHLQRATIDGRTIFERRS
jgi:hypothetical protein